MEEERTILSNKLFYYEQYHVIQVKKFYQGPGNSFFKSGFSELLPKTHPRLNHGIPTKAHSPKRNLWVIHG